MNPWKKLWICGIFLFCLGCTPNNPPFPSEQDVEQLKNWTQLSPPQQNQLRNRFQEKLKSRSQNTRQRAILALHESPQLVKDFFPQFQTLLENASVDQIYVLQMLQKIGITATSYVPVLQKILKNSSDEKFQLQVLQTLSALLLTQKEKLELWTNAFTSESPNLVLTAIAHLQHFSPQMTLSTELVLAKFQTLHTTILAKPLANFLFTLAPNPQDLRQEVENTPLFARYWISWVITRLEQKTKNGIPALLQSISQTDNPVFKRYLLLEIAHQKNSYYQNQILSTLLPLTKDSEWLYGLAYVFRTLPEQHERILPFLLKHFSHPDPLLREYAIETLSLLTEESLPLFLTLLTQLEKETEENVAIKLIQILKKNWKGKIPAYFPKREEAFLQCLQNEKFSIRFEAATALEYQKGVLTVLLEGLNSPSQPLRLRAISRLQRFSSENTLTPILLPLLSDSHPGIVQEAAEILAKQSSAPALEILIQKLKQTDRESRAQALKALLFFGKQSQQAFPYLPLTDEDEIIRLACVSFLGQLQIPSPEYLTPLLLFLQDPHPIIRLHAKRALKKIHPSPTTILPLIAQTFPLSTFGTLLFFFFIFGAILYLGIRGLKKYPFQKPLKTVLINSPHVYIFMIITGAIALSIWILQRETYLCFGHPQEFSLLQIGEDIWEAWYFLARLLYQYFLAIFVASILLFYTYFVWTNKQRIQEGISFRYRVLLGIVPRIFGAIWLGYTLIFVLFRWGTYLQTIPYGAALQLLWN